MLKPALPSQGAGHLATPARTLALGRTTAASGPQPQAQAAPSCTWPAWRRPSLQPLVKGSSDSHVVPIRRGPLSLSSRDVLWVNIRGNRLQRGLQPPRSSPRAAQQDLQFGLV